MTDNQPPQDSQLPANAPKPVNPISQSGSEPANDKSLPEFPDLDKPSVPADKTESFSMGGTGAGTEQLQSSDKPTQTAATDNPAGIPPLTNQIAAMAANQAAGNNMPAAGQPQEFMLCPYCGHVQNGGDKCEECHGLFEPLSRRATQISMGPWFIRDKNKPFMPGFSFYVLQKMIRSGKIRETTILRGPSTRQFWSVAKNVPGVAHLLGICHSCGATLDNAGSNGMVPGSSPVAPPSKCPQCGILFPTPSERNELGLMYKTENEARQAKQALDKELDALYGKPQAPSPTNGNVVPPATNQAQIPSAPSQTPLQQSGALSGMPPQQSGNSGNPGSNDLLSQILGPINQWQNSETDGDITAGTNINSGNMPMNPPPQQIPGINQGSTGQAVGEVQPIPNSASLTGAQGVLGSQAAQSPQHTPGTPSIPGIPGLGAGMQGMPPAQTQHQPQPGQTGQDDLLSSILGGGVPGAPDNSPGMASSGLSGAAGMPPPQAPQPAAQKSGISNITWLLIIVNVVLVMGLVLVLMIMPSLRSENTNENNTGTEAPTKTGADKVDASAIDTSDGSGDMTNAATVNTNLNQTSAQLSQVTARTPETVANEVPIVGKPSNVLPPLDGVDDFSAWDQAFLNAINLAATNPEKALADMEALEVPNDATRRNQLQEKINQLKNHINSAENVSKFFGQ